MTEEEKYSTKNKISKRTNNKRDDQFPRVRINITRFCINFLLLVVFLYGAFIFIVERSKGFSKSDIFEADFSKRCESGEWIDLASGGQVDFSKSYRGNLVWGKKEELSSNGENYARVVPGKYSLDYFIGKEVEVMGVTKGPEVHIQKIRCIGEETKPEIIKFRRDLMGYVSINIDEIAPEKPQKGKWIIDEFYFINGNNFYVSYFSSSEEAEEYEENRLLLLRAQDKKSESFEIKQLAYILPSIDGRTEAEVISGDDIYKDEKSVAIYEYDYDEGEWLLAE